MPRLDTPLQLAPVFKPKFWGRRDLNPIYGRRGEVGWRGQSTARSSKDAEPTGEVWLTDDAACFLNGPPAGMTLARAVERYAADLCGTSWSDGRFPILAKYLFTSDWLSVQVHPDDDYARLNENGSSGKCEMWYVIRTSRNAQVILGLNPAATMNSFENALETGKVRELLRGIHPRTGEAMFVPPGTIHALGPGLVLFEAEQNADITYRLDDFGRLGLDGKPRPLHREKGLAVIRPNLPAIRDLPRLEFPETYGARRYVLACRFFAIEEFTLRRTARFKSSPKRVEGLAPFAGEGRVETAAGWLNYRTGETWLIPPGTGEYRLVPREVTRLLKFYVPDLDEDFREPLFRRRVGWREIRKICFD